MVNNTWVLVNLLYGSKPIGSKWVFKKKMLANGSVDKFKARLVVKGFAQKEGIAYSPVVCISTTCLLIAVAAIQKMVIHQMDVKTVFLYENLIEEIYTI